MRKSYIILLVALIFIGTGVIFNCLFAVEIDWIIGDVKYSHLGKEWREAEVGLSLFPGDMVKTGEGSEATLTGEDYKIFISENTKFTVSERFQDGEKRRSFMLFLGRIKMKLGKKNITEPEVRTQTVNLTVRGTEFEVASGYDGSSMVVISEGVVSVRGKRKELVLEKGEGTEVRFGEEPEKKFKVITKVIDWNEWFKVSKESIKGREEELLGLILEKFDSIISEIKDYEELRKKALSEKQVFLEKRDEALEKGDEQSASEYTRLAAEKSKIAYHAIVNIRFLALSSIGLFDMSEMIYKGIEKPSRAIRDICAAITEKYGYIEKNYLREGDRERLEQKAGRRKGCIKIL